MKATDVLKKQHKDVMGLFEEVLEAEDPESRRKLCEAIERELKVHTRIEEEIFYPAVRGLGDEGDEMVLEALEEHHVVDLVLAELPRVDPEDERFEAKLTVLQELVRHHAKEEEKAMFKTAQQLGKNELEELGERLQARAAELKGEFRQAEAA
jgi:hemerythrin superfamily protein